MDFTYDDEQQALREAVRGLLATTYADHDARRRTVAEAPGFDRALWGRLAEMGHFADAKDYERWQAPHMAFHRGLTAPAGARVNALLEQLSDHAERYRRVHITRSPKAWQTAGHREILDAAKKGDREKAGRLMATHLSSNAFDVMELLEPGYDAARLRQTLEDIGARPKKRAR